MKKSKELAENVGCWVGVVGCVVLVIGAVFFDDRRVGLGAMALILMGFLPVILIMAKGGERVVGVVFLLITEALLIAAIFEVGWASSILRILFRG
jgi:hypothetical protein